MNDIFNIALLQNTLRSATPIILAAMGGSLTEQAGIMNIGMDGMMLLGAFFAVCGSYFFASSAMGVLFAIAAGVAVGLLFALFVVGFKSDEFIIGMALVGFASGLTVFLLRMIFGVKGSFSDAGIVPLPTANIPRLDNIPVLGPLLNHHSIFVYISWALVGLLYLFLFKTPWGGWMRAAGEHPASLRSAGINPTLIKVAASVLSGVLCALAGAHMSLGYLTLFSENMSADRGYVAFACVIFGNANPLKVFCAALLFGLFDALGLRLQGVGIPSQLSSTIPYFTTFLMMIYVTYRARKKGLTIR